MVEQGLEISRVKEATKQAMQAEISSLKQALFAKESEQNSARKQAELYKLHSNSFSDARQRFRVKLLLEDGSPSWVLRPLASQRCWLRTRIGQRRSWISWPS